MKLFYCINCLKKTKPDSLDVSFLKCSCGNWLVVNGKVTSRALEFERPKRKSFFRPVVLPVVNDKFETFRQKYGVLQ